MEFPWNVINVNLKHSTLLHNITAGTAELCIDGINQIVLLFPVPAALCLGLWAWGLSCSVLLFPVPAALGHASLLHFAFLGVQVPGAKVLLLAHPPKSVQDPKWKTSSPKQPETSLKRKHFFCKRYNSCTMFYKRARENLNPLAL